MEQHSSDEINLLDYWRVIKRRKRLIGVVVGAVTVLTVIVSLVMPKYYKANAVIMPVGKSGGGGLAALAGQFGGLASLAGLGGAGGQTPAQQMMALLRTRTLAEEIINEYDLMTVLFKKAKIEVKVEEGQRSKVKGENREIASSSLDELGTPRNDISESRVTPARQGFSGGSNEPRKRGQTMEDAVGALLASYVKFVDDKKNGTITISAEFKNPKLSADVANGYVEGLQKFINENAFTVAKRNRIFIEGQLAQNKRELLEAGKELNEFYKGGRVSSVESKIDVPITNPKSEALNPKQIQNPNFKIQNEETKDPIQAELERLQRQKEEVEGVIGKEAGSRKQEAGSDPSPPATTASAGKRPSPPRHSATTTLADKYGVGGQEGGEGDDLTPALSLKGEGVVKGVPQQVYLQYLTLRRNLLTQINTLLTQQYEMAKIEEAKDELAFQVIDPARVPEKRFKPKRRQMVMMAFVSSLFIGVFGAFFLEYIERMKRESTRI